MKRSTYRHQAGPETEDKIGKHLRELAGKRQQFGYRRLTVLLKREGHAVNHKRVHQVFREMWLQVLRKRCKRMKRTAERLPEVTHVDQRWAMDFVSDGLGGWDASFADFFPQQPGRGGRRGCTMAIRPGSNGSFHKPAGVLTAPGSSCAD